MTGELCYFLGLQMHQSKYEAFIIQAKYCKEFLKILSMKESKVINTLMTTSCDLDKGEIGKPL